MTSPVRPSAAAPADEAKICAAVRRGVDRALAEHRAARHAPVPADPTPAPLASCGPSAAEAGPRLTTSQGDVLRPEGMLPPVPVINSTAWGPFWARAGGATVETASLARALEWGEYLFGARGFAVLEARSLPGRFTVTALDAPLTIASFGGWGEGAKGLRLPPGVAAHGVGSGYSVFRAGDYHVVAVGLGGRGPTGGRLYPVLQEAPGTRWSAERAERLLAETTPQDRVTGAMAARAARGWLDAPEDDPAVVDRLSMMDRRLFATLGWQERAGHLIRLTRFQDAVFGDPAQTGAAITELVASARSLSEVEAMFAVLRHEGLYERLFTRFDKPVFTLLVALGELRPARRPDPRFLRDLLQEMLSSPSTLTKLTELGETGWDWLRGTVASFKDLPLLPVALATAVPQLARAADIMRRATAMPPDPVALLKVAEVTRRMGTTVWTALAGLELVERLGLPYGTRPTGAPITASLARRLRALLALEVLSEFVGLAEIRVVGAAASGRSRELIALVRGLRGAKLAERAAEGAARIDRLEALLSLLADAAKLPDGIEAARLLRTLPDVYAAEAAGLAERAPVGVTARVLLRAPDEGPVTRFLRDGLELAALVERKASGAAAVTPEMARGLHRLLATGWPRGRLLPYLDGIPAGELPVFLEFAGRLRPEQLRELGAGVRLLALARSTPARHLLNEVGADLVLEVFRRRGRRIERFEEFVAQLYGARTALRDPAEYQRLLDRLAAGERAAYDLVMPPRVRPARTGKAAERRAPLIELRDAATRDQAAGVRLTDYESAPPQRLLDLEEQGDPVATALLDEQYGGRSRKLLVAQSSNPAMRERLGRDLIAQRERVEQLRAEETAAGRFVPSPPEAPDWEGPGAPTRKALARREGTLAVSRTNVPALAHELLETASPRALGEVDPAARIQVPEHMTKVPRSARDAEVPMAQKVDARLSALSPEDRARARGCTVWMRVDQPVCSSCRAHGGVLEQLSAHHPDITFEIAADETPEILVYRAGKRVDKGGPP
ncbi:hypothetical protein [Streptomyces sp. NPDC056468]|uniref:hypothetical protein n=1 Tax=Streptomyces sp. NPDC056468 TaxID=3345830 RepID=UPI0036B8BFE2